MARSSRPIVSREARKGTRARIAARALLTIVTPLVAGCAGAAGDGASALGRDESPIVYGSDDRHEYFEPEAAPFRALMSESIVALVRQASLRPTKGGAVLDAPSLGESDALCPGERFADEPAAAFCSGVLVDWDLVLTAGHCARLFPLNEVVIAFGYYYTKPGELALGSDTRHAVEVVSESLDGEGAEPRLDYAWLRLDRRAEPPRRPAPLRNDAGPLRAGDPLTFIASAGGTPVKVDDGATVHDAREGTNDYFVADTDSSHGSSGGGAFDRDLRLAGILVRGQSDFALTPSGCNATVREPNGAAAAEEFTYTHRALEGLCREDASGRSICDLPPSPSPPAASCALVSWKGGDDFRRAHVALVALLVTILARARGARTPGGDVRASQSARRRRGPTA